MDVDEGPRIPEIRIDVVEATVTQILSMLKELNVEERSAVMKQLRTGLDSKPELKSLLQQTSAEHQASERRGASADFTQLAAFGKRQREQRTTANA